MGLPIQIALSSIAVINFDMTRDSAPLINSIVPHIHINTALTAVVDLTAIT